MKVRVGFVGTGGIAGLHMNNLSRMDGVELVAFCDVVEERAKLAADRFKGRVYTDHRRMYEEEELDAVYICIPPFAHTDQEVLAAEAKIALFVEKPIALNLDVALRAREAIEKAGIINSVGYHFRYFDTTDMAKEALQGKIIGMVLGYWMGGMPRVAWWRVLEESGGQFVEQTTHMFDLARYLAGEVTKVCAATALRALQEVPNLNVPDVGSALVWFQSGAIGCISNCCLLQGGVSVPNGTGVTVICPDLVLHVGASLSLRYANRTEEFRPQRDGHHYESECFIRAVANKDQSLIRSTYADGAKSLAVTLAVNESWQSGKVVEVAKI